MGDELGELLTRRERAQRHQDAATHGHAEGSCQPFGAVRYEETDARATAGPRRREALGVAARLSPQVVVSPAHDRPVGGACGNGVELPMGLARLREQRTEGERADARFALGRRSGERRHLSSSTSTSPAASTLPSWLVIVTFTVATGADSSGSTRTSVTSPSRNVTSPSNGGERPWSPPGRWPRVAPPP